MAREVAASGRFASVLRNRSFALYLVIGNAGSMGYAVYAISILWLAYQLSGNLFVAGTVVFIEYASYSFTFLVGPIVDRVRDKRDIFLTCYPLQAAAALVLGIGIYDHFLTVALLLGLVALISVLWDFTWAAGNAIPSLLLRPDEQFAAAGISGVVTGGNSIAGFAIGGVLILVVGPAGGQLLYAALLGAGAILCPFWSVPAHPDPPKPYFESFRAGWTILGVGEGRPLLQFAAVDGLRGFFTSAPALLITLLANVLFAAHSLAYGLLFVGYVVGGSAAGLFAGVLNPRRRVGWVLVGSLLATALAVAVAVHAAPILWASVLAWFAVGFGINAYYDAKGAYLLGGFPPETMARLTSNLYVFPGVAGSIGALAIGSLANSLPAVSLGYFVALGFLAAGLLGTALPAVKRLRY